MSEINMILIV